MNTRLYPSDEGRVNDLEVLRAAFLQSFAGQPDLAALTGAATRVLATAAALFYLRGAAATSVRDLTRACGLSPGALYNHFASKDDVLYTLVRHGHTRMERRLDAALDGAGSDPAARLAAFVHAYVLGHLDRPEFAQVVRREYLHLSPPRYRDVVARRRAVRRRLSSILEAGTAAGRFDVVGGRPAVTAQSVMLLDMCSRTSEWFDPGGAIDASTLAQRYVVAACRLVGVASSPTPS